MKIELPKEFVIIIEEMYEGASISMRSLCGETKDFSAFEFLFIFIMHDITLDVLVPRCHFLYVIESDSEVSWCHCVNK